MEREAGLMTAANINLGKKYNLVPLVHLPRTLRLEAGNEPVATGYIKYDLNW